MIKDHIFGVKEFVTYEFVVFRIEEMKLNKSKISISIEKNSSFDFEVSDEVQSIEFPYIYILQGSQIKIISLLTSKNVNFLSYRYNCSLNWLCLNIVRIK